MPALEFPRIRSTLYIVREITCVCVRIANAYGNTRCDTSFIPQSLAAHVMFQTKKPKAYSYFIGQENEIRIQKSRTNIVGHNPLTLFLHYPTSKSYQVNTIHSRIINLIDCYIDIR